MTTPTPRALQEVLRGGRQCDEDGVEIIMSREACCVAADTIDRLERDLIAAQSENAKLKAHAEEMAEEITADAGGRAWLAKNAYRRDFPKDAP